MLRSNRKLRARADNTVVYSALLVQAATHGAGIFAVKYCLLRSWERYNRHAKLPHESMQGEVRAIGYMHSGRDLSPNTSLLPWAGTPAGGGYSTVDDLLRFALALRSGKLISRPLLREATTAQTHYGYSLGFVLFGEGGFGHTGGMPGANGELLILPRSRYLLIVLVNRDPRMASDIPEFIRQSLTQPSI